MALETATYLTSLNSANPPGGDPVSQADDHIRLIKQVLLSTFPNINAAITSTPKNLNSDLVPVGSILFWYGSTASIPAGWGYCNGSTYAKLDGSGNIISPDLRDKFVVCTGTTYTQGLNGSPTHQHGTTAAFTGAAFTIAQANLPAYNLTVTDTGHVHTITDPGHAHTYSQPLYSQNWGGVGGYTAVTTGATSTATTGITINSATTGITVASGGSGTAITPTGSIAVTEPAAQAIPPYFSLVPMIKL